MPTPKAIPVIFARPIHLNPFPCLKIALHAAFLVFGFCLATLECSAQLTINCPSNQVLFTAPGQCTRSTTYSQPTTNATTTQTASFSYTGGLQTYTVPNGATSVTIQCWGAQGADAVDRLTSNGAGARGGYAVGTRAVSGGQVLYIYVGGQGSTNGSGGYNGGGSGGNSNAGSSCFGGPAGGGGGASDVRFGSTALSGRIIVAGGGGGGGRDYCNGTCQPCGCGGGGGGAGGLNGGDAQAGFNCGFSYPGTNVNFGRGATQVAGGASAPSDGGSGNPGGAGALGIGGNGAAGDYDVAGGGGGGGYYGGGGGGGANSGSGVAGGGGGGGSSYLGGVTGGSTSSNIRTGNGQVIITASVPVNITQTAGLPSGSNFPLGNTVNTFQVTQGAQTATCSFNISVVDNEDPSVSCPSAQSVSLNGSCQASMPDFRSLASASDNCTGSPNKTQSPSPGSIISGTGNQTVTITATDLAGNNSSCSFTITKNDVTNPTITCPTNLTLNLNASCSASLPNYTILAGASDNCTTAPTVTQSPAAGTTVTGTGSMTITLTATDATGRTANCTFNVTKTDATAPAVTCPANQTVTLNASCSATVPNYLPQSSVTDGCTASPPMTQSPAAGTLINSGGSQTITISSTDGAGNTGNCGFTLTAVDNVNPSVTCPANQNFSLNSGCSGQMPNFASSANATDNCMSGLTVSQSPAAGSTLSGTGPVSVSLTATDGSGNSANCSFTLTKVDVTAPSLNCPATANLTLNGSCQATLPNYAAQATISDNCTGSPTVVQNPVAGTLVTGTGNTNVTLTVTDASGNSSACTIAVSKVDNSAPSVTCPGNQTVNLSASCTAAMPNYVPQSSASDNCSGNPTRTQSPNPGTVITGTGSQTVTITATDGSGNSGNCTFTVTANDVSNPSISCPSPQTVTLSASCSAQMPDLRPSTSASDNCTASPTKTQTPAPGSTISGSGGQTVTLTATDGSGNTSSCTTTVTFLDLVQPTVNCPANTTIALNPNCQALVPNYTTQASAADNCTANPTKTQSPAAGTLFNGGGPHTVTITATDATGNSANCTFQVSGVDQVAPAVSCPANQTLALGTQCTAVLPNYTPLASATDNCTANPVKTQSPPVGTSFSGPGTSTVTITATDGSSLTATCSFTVNIVDQSGPTLTCPPADTVYGDVNCEALLPDYTSMTGNVDNCSTILNLSQSPFGGTIMTGSGATQQVVMTALDQAGNIGTCTLSVVLADTLGPVFAGCPNTVTVTPSSFNCNPVVQWSPPTAADACGGTAVINSTHNPGNNFPVGTTLVTYTATDLAGNQSQCRFNVVVRNPVLDNFVTVDPPQPCSGQTVVLTAFSGLNGYSWSNSATTNSIQVTSSGWYWVDMTDAANCTGRDSVFVNFLPSPNPVITVNGLDLCTTPFQSYQWYMNGNPIPGATSQCITPVSSGNFTVAVTSPNGCVAESPVMMHVGKDEGLESQAFVVYPNPARDALYVRMAQPLTEPGSILLYDMAGRIVQRILFERLDSEALLDLSGVADGTYFIEIASGTFRGRRKVVRIN